MDVAFEAPITVLVFLLEEDDEDDKQRDSSRLPQPLQGFAMT